MAWSSFAIVDEQDLHVFTATRDDDSAVVKSALREYFALVTRIDGGKEPTICMEGFGFDHPLAMNAVELAHGVFDSMM